MINPSLTIINLGGRLAPTPAWHLSLHNGSSKAVNDSDSTRRS